MADNDAPQTYADAYPSGDDQGGTTVLSEEQLFDLTQHGGIAEQQHKAWATGGGPNANAPHGQMHEANLLSMAHDGRAATEVLMKRHEAGQISPQNQWMIDALKQREEAESDAQLLGNLQSGKVILPPGAAKTAFQLRSEIAKAQTDSDGTLGEQKDTVLDGLRKALVNTLRTAIPVPPEMIPQTPNFQVNKALSQMTPEQQQLNRGHLQSVDGKIEGIRNAPKPEPKKDQQEQSQAFMAPADNPRALQPVPMSGPQQGQQGGQQQTLDPLTPGFWLGKQGAQQQQPQSQQPRQQSQPIKVADIPLDEETMRKIREVNDKRGQNAQPGFGVADQTQQLIANEQFNRVPPGSDYILDDGTIGHKNSPEEDQQKSQQRQLQYDQAQQEQQKAEQDYEKEHGHPRWKSQIMWHYNPKTGWHGDDTALRAEMDQWKETQQFKHQREQDRIRNEREDRVAKHGMEMERQGAERGSREEQRGARDERRIDLQEWEAHHPKLGPTANKAINDSLKTAVDEYAKTPIVTAEHWYGDSKRPPNANEIIKFREAKYKELLQDFGVEEDGDQQPTPAAGPQAAPQQKRLRYNPATGKAEPIQ